MPTISHAALIALSLSSVDGLSSCRRTPRNLRLRSRGRNRSESERNRVPSMPMRAIPVGDGDSGLWDADGPLSGEWASSLPLPENAPNEPLARRARRAMAGTDPPALEGRCAVDFDGCDGRARWLHVDPPVIVVDDFLTDAECDEVLKLQSVSPPPGAGRVIKIESRLSDANERDDAATAVRRSTTWYVRYGAPAATPLLEGLLALLPSVRLEQLEEVQLVRYEGSGQGFGWHEDALAADEATPGAGGQRAATLLVYLDGCRGGRTLFRDLRGRDGRRLAVSPRKGRALLFFPSVTGTTTLSEAASAADSPRETFGGAHFDGARADRRTSHAGEPPGGGGRKNVAQIWVHSREHTPRVFGEGLNKHAEARVKNSRGSSVQ
ncbi:hypothetical protein ACHAWF_016021 [Thalassiosira exigua]